MPDFEAVIDSENSIHSAIHEAGSQSIYNDPEHYRLVVTRGSCLSSSAEIFEISISHGLWERNLRARILIII